MTLGFFFGARKKEIMDFKKFHLNAAVEAGAASAGYVTPTPIQTQAIPAVMNGLDVMGIAQTGTGKTAAFALPILHRLMQGDRGYVRALIIAPTRELAEQIHQAIQTLGSKTRLRSVTIYGGVNIGPQVQKLKQGAEIVVACPGRLLDHIGHATIKLARLEVLVLDEADHMFDMGFLPDIRRILKQIPRERQTLLFSATMPEEIKRLAHDVLRNPVTVQVDKVAPAVTVSHALYPVSEHLKTGLLLELLHHTDTESVLIFTRTKHRARRLGEQLAKAGYKAASLQGNLSQNRRKAALDGFRNGTFQILVATDIAARGIDVSQISHVINFDIPNTAEAYIHRIGRTGRAARSGDAFTLVTSEDTVMVRTIEKALHFQLERQTIKSFNYNVPAPQKEHSMARPTFRPAAKKTGVPAQARHKSRPAAQGSGAPKRHVKYPRTAL